jgi:hypothetical protein
MWKRGSAGKCWRKFWRKFRDERVPSRQTIYNLVSKLRTMELVIDKKQKHKRWVLIEEKLDDIGDRLEHTRRKSLKHLAQETGVSKSSARTATLLLKPSSESWCLVCFKCKKNCCMCAFNETVNCETYLRVEGRFQHLLWFVNKGKIFPSFQSYRHAESSAKFACASQPAVCQSRWSAESWARQVY